MSIWDFLENVDVWCICLKNEETRYNYVKKEFKRVGLDNVKFYRPERHTPGYVGCRLSHRHCAVTSSSNDKHALVFEDDVKFHKIKGIEKIKGFMETENWDIIRLGAIFSYIDKYKSGLWRAGALGTHAIMYNKNIVQSLFDENNFKEHNHIDDFLHDGDFKDYSLLESPCIQRAGLGSSINWWDNRVQQLMQHVYIFEKLQTINNSILRNCRFLPICIQKILSPWYILTKIGETF